MDVFSNPKERDAMPALARRERIAAEQGHLARKRRNFWMILLTVILITLAVGSFDSWKRHRKMNAQALAEASKRMELVQIQILPTFLSREFGLEITFIFSPSQPEIDRSESEGVRQFFEGMGFTPISLGQMWPDLAVVPAKCWVGVPIRDAQKISINVSCLGKDTPRCEVPSRDTKSYLEAQEAIVHFIRCRAIERSASE